MRLALWNRWLVITALILLGANTSLQAQNSATPWKIVVQGNIPESILISDRLRLWTKDQDGKATPAHAANQIETTGGKTVKRHHEELGRIQHPVWLRFSIQNTSANTFNAVLLHAQPTIEYHKAYIKHIDQQKTEGWVRLPGRHETAKKSLERDREPSYDIAIEGGQTVEVLFRWETFAPIKAPVEIWTVEGHRVSQQVQIMVYTAALMTPLLTLAALMMVKGISNIAPDKLFVGFVLADSIAASWITGLIPILFPLLDPTFLRQIGLIAYATLCFLAVFHAIRFLGLDSLCPRWALLLRLWAFIGSSCVFISVFISLYFSSQAVIVYGFLTAVLVASTCLYAMSHRVPFASTYAIAWGVYVLTAVIYVLYRFGMVPVIALGLAYFWQNAGVCLVLGTAIVQSVYSRDTRLRDALMLGERQRRELERLNFERDKLFAMASHDLRQPLQAIAINLGLIKKGNSEDSALVERIRLALVGMGDILSSLLDLRRGGTDQRPADLQSVVLSPLLDRLRDDYREQARRKQIGFRYVPSRQAVIADPVWLERVLRNLVTNALRYTDQGRVLIGARYGSRFVRICIVDTGRGLNKKQIELLNANFTSAPDPASRDSYGLGLFIARQLCEQMNGRLEVSSILGRGSRFEVILPTSRRR